MGDRSGLFVVLAWCLIFFVGGISAGSLLERFSRTTSSPAPGPDGETRPRSTRVGADTVPRFGPSRPRVAIVIDDLGWDRGSADVYEEIDQPLTMALMPGRPYSQWFYDRWGDRYEFLVHMPMEPLGYPGDDPGELALMTAMSDREVERRVRSIVRRYPKAVGFNNHMGSAFTQNRAGMNALMKELARHNLFYLDSLTTSSSVAEPVGDKWGVPVVENQVFLDRERTESAVRDQLKKLIARARERGSAIGIGHVQSLPTARVLREEMPRYAREGIDFVPLSDLVHARVARRIPSP